MKAKDPKYMDMQRLVIYSELLTKMIYDIDDVGMRAARAVEVNILDKETMEKIHNKLIPIIQDIEPKRIAIVKELNKRVKYEVGLIKGTSDLDQYLDSIKKEYPDMYLSKSEYDLQQDLKNQEVVDAQVVKPRKGRVLKMKE